MNVVRVTPPLPLPAVYILLKPQMFLFNPLIGTTTRIHNSNTWDDESYHRSTTNEVMSTHLSLGRSLERRPHCIGCEDPAEVRLAQNSTLSLGHESYRGSPSPSHRDRRRRGPGMRAGSGGRTWERGGRTRRGGWRQRRKDVRRKRKVWRGLLGIRMWSERRSPPPLSCYCDRPLPRLTLTPLKHTTRT